MIDWESTETDYLHNSYWISTVAVECTMTVLGMCFRSTHLQMKFLDVLVKCNINEDLHGMHEFSLKLLSPFQLRPYY